MPRPGKTIPKAPLAKIMQKSGAKRISDNGLDVLSDYLLDYATKISTRAIKIAKHSGRKTVTDADIRISKE